MSELRHLPMPPERRLNTVDWPEGVALTEGPHIVVGGPGTGKTEFLVRRADNALAYRISAAQAERLLPTREMLLSDGE